MIQLPDLNGRQIQTLRQGLERSFPGFDQLKMFLREQTERRLDDYAGLTDTLPIAAFKLIRGAEAEGWLHDLLIAAIATRPNRQEFAKVATELGLTAAGPNLTNTHPIGDPSQKSPQKALEDIIFGREMFIDVEAFLSAMSAMQSRICAIRMPMSPGTKVGTGFLVGPDLVLTNYHVMKEAIDEKIPSEDVELRFDVRMTADGQTLRDGTPYRLKPQHWLVDNSPYSLNDLSDPPSGNPASDELDYCLVRLAEPAGAARAGGSKDPSANQRGWIEISQQTPAGTAADNIFILQHPKARPLKLAIGRLLGFSANGARMSYDADTLGGSSGSPVFNSDLKLIGLHHRGDPNADVMQMTAEHNQGIPINRIIGLMQARGIERFWQE